MTQLTKEESVPVFGNEDVRASKVEKFKWTSSGKPTELAWIPKSELCIDYQYQRTTTNKALIKDITRTFNWVAFGALIVSRRHEKYWVIDGAHRLNGALQRSDVEKVPCLVFEQESLESEAGDFLSINNNRKSVSPIDRFRAEVVAGNERAAALNNFILSTGYKIANDSNPKSIECVKALQSEWNDDSERLKRLFPLILEMHKNSPRILGEVVKGLCALDKKRKINDQMSQKLTAAGAEVASVEMKRLAIRVGKTGPLTWSTALKKICSKKEIK